MGQPTVRGITGAAGEISLNSLRGLDAIFALTILSASNVNLRNAAIAAGWNGLYEVVATIPAGNVIQSSTTSVASLTIDGSFPGGVQLINNGTIIGRGGDGGQGAIRNTRSASAGGGGGTGLAVSVPVRITNVGTIAGGGGGGGGGGVTSYTVGSGKSTSTGYSQGGGGGGGAGFGSGGAGTGNGANGSTTTGGGGGTNAYDNGGSGGSAGAAGAAGDGGNIAGGAGGGAGGAAVTGSGNVTWIVTGTRLGTLA